MTLEIIPVAASFHLMIVVQGLCGQGKSGERHPCHLYQGKSGKVAMVRGKIALSYCRSGKNVIFHHHESVSFFSLHVKFILF